jgi:hypothetical protein
MDESAISGHVHSLRLGGWPCDTECVAGQPWNRYFFSSSTIALPIASPTSM